MMYQGSLFNENADTENKVSAFFHSKFLSLHYVEEEQIKELNWLYEEIQITEKENEPCIEHTLTQSILCNIDFKDKFLSTLHKHKTQKKSFWDTFQDWKYKGLFMLYTIIFSFIAFAVLSYFYLVPMIAENVAEKIPVKYEIELGEKVYNQSIDVSKIDKEKSLLLNEFYHGLNQKNNYPIQITYLKDDVVNAFAMPGGHIVIHEGIVKKLPNAEALAALMAHEATHITERHATRTLLKSLGGYMIVSLLFGDFTGIIAIAADNANAIYNLSYSRELEMDADNHGIAILLEERIDINGMIELFEILESEEKGQLSAESASFLSTHPLTKDRLQNAKTAKSLQKNAIPHLSLDTLFKKLKEN